MAGSQFRVFLVVDFTSCSSVAMSLSASGIAHSVINFLRASLKIFCLVSSRSGYVNTFPISGPKLLIIREFNSFVLLAVEVSNCFWESLVISFLFSVMFSLILSIRGQAPFLVFVDPPADMRSVIDGVYQWDWVAVVPPETPQ